MDPIAYLLMSKSTGNIIYDIFLIVIFLPLIAIIIDKSKGLFRKSINNFLERRRKKSLDLIGWENVVNGNYNFDFPFPMIAICHHLIENEIAKNTTYFNKSMNGVINSWGNHFIDHSAQLHYIISSDQNIKYNEHINIEINNDQFSTNSEKQQSVLYLCKIRMSIFSDDIKLINDFVMKCNMEYNNYLSEINKNKLYHFIFQGTDKEGKYLWKTNVLSDLSNSNNMNFETFDTMFCEHTEKLKRDIDRLNDIEYYKKTGSKRKKGYLFYGPPGCGKTSSAMAMANYGKRHIVEVPMSRIKTNADIEEIVNLHRVGNVRFNNYEVILLFDEIDSGLDALSMRTSEKKDLKKKDSDDEDSDEKESEKNTDKSTDKKNVVLDAITKSIMSISDSCEKDKICLGALLSRLDGVGAYNGIIFIATTNCIDEISPAIYRHGRLNLTLFDYMRTIDMINMINYFYKINLTDSQVLNIPDYSCHIAPSSMREYIENYANDLDGLLNFLKRLHQEKKEKIAK